MRAALLISLKKRVPLALFAIGILTVCANANAQTPEDPKKILILFSHQSDQPAQAILEQAMRSTLRADLPVAPEIYSEYLDAVRTPLEQYETDLVRQLQTKYSDKRLDLIFIVNPPALRFLLKNRTGAFADVPVVFIVLDQQNLAGIDPVPNMTGVWGEVNYGANTDLALKLHPDTKQLVVVSGVGEWDDYWRSLVQEELRPFESRVAISYITGFTIPEQKAALATLPPHSLVLFVSSTRDRAGNNPGNLEVIRQISPASNAPVYGSSDAQLGLGIVGGQLTSFNALGVEGARIGIRVLHGERPETVPAHGVGSVPMFDARQLQRWGIREDALPAGSVVQFRSPSVWEEYRWYWIGLGAVIVAEALLIGALLVLRMRRRQAQAENIQLSGRLDEIVSNVPGIVWETRTDPAIGRRRTTFISGYVTKMLGYTPNEWLEKPPGFGASIVAEEDRDRVVDESEAVMKTGEVGVSEFRWYTKDGGIRWVENYLSPVVEEGEVVGLRGVALDITDRKMAEATAREAEEKDRAILAAIPDLMFLQTVDGVYLDYHAKDRHELFVPPETFVGKDMRDVLPPALAEQLAECFSKVEEGGEPQVLDYSIELDGVEKWFEARMVRSGDRILSIVRDITDLKRSEQEAHELSGRLIRAQEDERARLARELHDGVSQNLALFSIELALFGRDAPHDKKSVDKKMKELSSRVAELSGEIRRLSQELHPVKLEQLGLVTAVRGFCHEVEAAHEVTVDFEVHDVPTSISSNVSLCLYRIVQESLQNIVKHSGASNAHVLLSRNGHGIKLKITDDGCGFQPQASAKKASLGLVSMRERIALLNGKLTINSEVGKGTEIEATVPVDFT
jgi:PAS domain S-box-containing protein